MKYLPLALLAALCSACTAGLLETRQPASQTYFISVAPSPATTDGSVAALPIDLTVARPIVSPGLFTERIAVRHADRRLEYYAASRWSATADVLVQSLLVQSLRDSGGLRSVQNDLSAFTTQYLLQTELRDFQAEYDPAAAGPVVRVSLVCTLGRVRARQPVAEYTAQAQVNATDNSMAAVIAAFEAAYREAAQQVVERTLTAAAAGQPGSAGQGR